MDDDDKDLLPRFWLRGQCGLPFGLWHADPSPLEWISEYVMYLDATSHMGPLNQFSPLLTPIWRGNDMHCL